MDDWELLKEYAATRSQAAFAALVSRHVDFVYSAALRQVGQRQTAEDVTQGVFLILSQKAEALARQTPGVLAGWLFTATRLTAANAIRSEKRRRINERKGQTMHTCRSEESAAEWDGISPHLDAALANLGRTDRDAILLRYFSDKSHREIANALGLTEEAVRKRIARAIEKLRRILAGRGVVIGSVGLTTLLTANALQAAPPALAGACGAAGCGSAGAALARGVSIAMGATKLKLGLAGVLMGLLLVGGGVALVRKLVRPIASPAPAALMAQPVAALNAIHGIVLSSEGEPIAGAEVFLATERKKVDIYAAKPSPAAIGRSGDDGSFSFEPPQGPCLVVVRHQLGYVQITREQLETSSQITLQPWSCVEGVVKIGSAPAAGVTVVLSRFSDSANPYSRLVQHEMATEADAQGHFRFEHVAPGDAWVWRRVDPQGFLAALEYVDAQSSKTMQVALGGHGRAVIGRIALPKRSDEKIDWTFRKGSSFTAGLMPSRLPLIETHAPFDPNRSWEEQRLISEAWNRTAAGQWAKRNSFGICFWINANGTFRIDDVSEGSHRLSVAIYREDKGAGYYDRFAYLDTPIAIGQLADRGGQSDQPLDLGTLTIAIQPHLRLGRAAPPLNLKKLDGSAVKLADFAGKFVLLVPWSKARQPSKEDIHFIKLAHDENTKAGKLVILTMDFDNDPTAARDLAKATGLEEIAIHCTGKLATGNLLDIAAGKALIPLDFVQAPSLISLIDPEGKVAAKNLAGEEIEGAVYRAIFAR